MTDREIVDLYWERNEIAIQETSEKYHHYLKKVASNILMDEEDCEESVNDTYLAAWNSMPEQRPSILSTYLGKITRQKSIDLFRKKNSKKRRESQYALSLQELEECLTDGSSTETQVDQILLQDTICDFLEELSEKERNLFVGRYFFLDSMQEVAAYCSVSLPNAKTTLYRVRQKLKQHLQKEGWMQ